MDNDREIDVLIVGQGLAGSAVAMRAIEREYRVLVVDEPSANRSSVVAAGLFNPVTGQKLLKTWLADQIFPGLFDYYRRVEQLTASRFFYPMPLYRPFLSVEEQNEWMGRSADDRYIPFIAGLSSEPSFGQAVNDPFGGLTLRSAGYIDTQGYLRSVRAYLDARGAFREGAFDYNSVELGGDHVRYGDINARKVIFCQGVANASNPWFKTVRVNSLKGEFLTVQCDWERDVILNRGVYFVPGRTSGEWRVGATYNRMDHLPEVTDQARREITGKLGDLIRFPYTITGQQWGVRPTSPDRKPIIGAHPQFPNLIIFNGFGTKGVSLAPYFSAVLIRWMEKKGTIDKEADVTRFN